MKKAMKLTVTDLEFMVHLGWTDEERRRVRRVLVNIEFVFAELPKAAFSDDLNDTPVCYQKIEWMLREAIEDKEFKLMEHLGQHCYQLIEQALPVGVDFTISLTKFLRDHEGSRTVELSSR